MSDTTEASDILSGFGLGRIDMNFLAHIGFGFLGISYLTRKMVHLRLCLCLANAWLVAWGVVALAGEAALAASGWNTLFFRTRLPRYEPTATFISTECVHACEHSHKCSAPLPAGADRPQEGAGGRRAGRQAFGALGSCHSEEGGPHRSYRSHWDPCQCITREDQIAVNVLARRQRLSR